MEDPFLGDPFLDDMDLFYEGLLSEEDARRLYHRGEITHEQLTSYLNRRQRTADQQTGNSINPWIIAVLLLFIFFLCFIVIISGL